MEENTVSFKTTSRHISQLGRELVTDFVTALVELIKNSYDADAKGVNLYLLDANTTKSKIIIVDSGQGMTVDEFKNRWMVIGTNNKVSEPYTSNGRKKSGKKGIGRFSVERLAETVKVFSFPEVERAFKVSINWNRYEEINIAILNQRINVLLNHRDSSAAKVIKSQIEFFLLNPNINSEDKEKVCLAIGAGYDNYETYYDKETLEILQTQLLSILGKYEASEQLVESIKNDIEYYDDNVDRNTFEYLSRLHDDLGIKESKTGLILVLEGLRDEWRQKDIDKLQKELRLLVAPYLIDKDPFHIKLEAPDFRLEDNVMVNDILDMYYAKICGKISDNGLNSIIQYQDVEGKTKELFKKYDEPLLCGEAKIEIYFFLRTSKYLAGESMNFRYALQVLDSYSGIKIYRDNFRVKPYGDQGNDWLLLDQSKVRDTHGYLVGNNQTIGVIQIGDETNPLLVDATNREGIIENEAYEHLKEFTIECTNLISALRYESYSEEQKKNKELEEEKKKIDTEIEKISNELESKQVVNKIEEIKNIGNTDEVKRKVEDLVSVYKEDALQKQNEMLKLKKSYDDHYEKTKVDFQKKIDFQESELNLYKNLASLGMLTSSFGHETSDIVNRISNSIYLLDYYLEDSKYKDEGKGTLEIVDRDFKRIKAYSNLIVNFLKKRKRKPLSLLDVNSAIKEVCVIYKDIADSFGVSIEERYHNSCEFNIRQIDLESIVINMITNAFEQVKGTQNRKIIISVNQSENEIVLIFEDSGSGVADGMEKLIFLPFNTTKDDGIGLGLCIVRDLVESHNGSIEVERSRELGGAKFVVKFEKGVN